MRSASQISLLFPLPLPGAGVDNQRTFWRASAEFFEQPGGLHIGQFDIDDTSVCHAVDQQGLSLLKGGAVDDAIMFCVNAASYGLRQFRMWGQYQQSLHEGRLTQRGNP